MDHKNDPTEGAAKMLLERLKSNGTFDEFRRHCASDIDAKPTFLNLKQRIESNSFKFLNKIKYTPELNKNIIRERLKKYLFDGREAHDIDEGIDRILNQVLAPRMINVFEPKIEIAVNEYLGIKNEVPLTEVNGLKESNMNTKNGSDVERNLVSNPKIDLTLDTENIDNIDETSPEFEPLSSVLDNENSNDESISGMSDLVSVGSPIQIVSKENHENTSNGFENDKNVVEKPQHIDKNGIINHKNTKPDDVKISNNIEKLKTNDSKPKSKHSFSRTSRHSSSQEKSSTHKSKDRNSSSHRSTSQENNDIIKKSSNSKDRKNSSHRHRSDSKDKKHKHDKKSNQSDRDKTPKRDRKNSRSDKKEKSSSLCKEPKSLNGNRSDDESNAGGSSKQKSNVHKNKSSTSDKSKSSSGHHKSSRKDNSSKDVVDKSKDKSSISKTSSRSSHKSNRTHSKKRKRSLTIDSTSPESNPSEEKKPKWSDFMTNDEQDAANVLLSMSEISYESSHSEIITENIIFIDNSSFTDDTLKTPSSTTGNILKNQDNFNQTKNIEFGDNNSEETNFNLKTSDMEPPKPSVESVDNINEKCIPPINRVAEEVCSVDAENPILFPCKDVATQNTSFDNLKITSEPNTQVELEVPKLKLKLSQNHVNFFNYEKRRKHHKNHKNHKSKVKKLRLSCYSSNEVNVPVIDNVSITINSEQNNQKSICDIDIKRNDSVIIPPNQETLSLPKDSEIKNTQPLENNESLYTFKGFSQSEAIPCKNYEKLRHLIITLKKSLTDENIKSIIDNDGFKGFTCEELHPCENRDLVNLQLNKLKDEVGFKGFSKKEILMSSGHKFIKQQLELSKKQNDTNNDQPSVTCGGNGIKNGKSFKEVMSIIYESNNDGSSTPKKICSKPVTVEKKGTVVNNNNHDITASNDWVVKQEMKYKLLPVKVKLERLMEYRYNETKRMPDSPQVS